MITKIINSYDIHINGQLLRVVEAGEITVNAVPFNSKTLLMNEPRGNKYINLITYRENLESAVLEITLDGSDIIDNKELLLKSLVKSLVDRKRIKERENYSILLDGEELAYRNEELCFSMLYKINQNNDTYSVNGKTLKIAETELQIEVNNLTEIKALIEEIEHDFDYLVLYNKGKFISVNKNGSIIPYPVIEVISLLAEKYQGAQLTALTGDDVEIKNNKVNYKYYLVSNSQFYIDDTDIYEEGFIIK